MKREYIKFNKAIELLKEGCQIYTDRGFGGAPYSPLFFKLWKGNEVVGEIHHATIKKLIAEKIINGADGKHHKYKLCNK